MQFGFIFDMDGTMVDNMMVHHRAWQAKLAEEGLNFTLEEVIAHCHGRNDEILIRVFEDRLSPEERRRISSEKEAQYRLIFKDRLQLVDGLMDFLQRAHELRIPMAIGTAALIENVDFVLDTLNIRHLFTAIVSERDVTKGKPDPEVFHKAATLMGIPVENCLVFEDSPVGIRTARNAGMPAVIVTTTHRAEEFAGFDNVLQLIKDYTEVAPDRLLDQLRERAVAE